MSIPEYTLRRSSRKTVCLEITRDCAVLVRAPRRMPQAEIDRFVARHASWIQTHLEKQRRRRDRLTLTDSQIAALKRRAEALLPERVEHFARLMNVKPNGVRITSAATRFGSCSAKDRLCFSWRLMLYPDAAIDYVVVHELAHILHKNHGNEFYAYIASILPDHKDRRALLRSE